MLLLGLTTLTGCSLEGRLDVASPDAVGVDLTVRSKRSPYCNGDIPGLSVTPGVEGGAVTSCHYLGTVDVADLGYALSVSQAGEYLAVALNPFQVPASGPRTGSQSDVDALDVTITFPGEVVEHSGGTADGRDLRITDPRVLLAPGGLRAAALDHAGPANWVWWSGVGLGIGVVAGLALVGLSRRWSLVVLAANAPPAGVEQQAPSTPEVAAVPTGRDPSVWAPDDR